MQLAREGSMNDGLVAASLIPVVMARLHPPEAAGAR